MFHRYKKTKILPTLIIILSFVFVYAPFSTKAQSLYKLNDSGPPGGSGSTTTIQNDNDKSSTIFVLMGVTAGLVLFYKFFIQKKKDKQPELDSTSTNSNMIRKFSVYPSVAEKVSDNDNPLPFQLYMGIRRNDPVYNKKTYILGVSFNL